MEFKCIFVVLSGALLCLSIVVDGQYYGRRRYGYNRFARRSMYPMRRRFMSPRMMPMGGMGGNYYSRSVVQTPSLAGPMTGYHDNGLDQLLRQRYRNPMMQRRHNQGVFAMFAAEELGCKTVNDVMGPDFAHYEPSRCSKALSCLHSGSGRPKQVQAGQVCMCCPPYVTNRRIMSNANTRGRERYYEKVNTLDPSEMGYGRDMGYGSDMMKDRMQMMRGFTNYL